MNIIYPVPQILQNPELPNGCEITSLCEILNYYGIPADKCDLADNYLPRSERWYGADPDEVYLGNPRLDDSSPETGYYCFSKPLIKAAEKYFSVHDIHGLSAVDLSGSALAELENVLISGSPFIFWASLHFNDIRFDPCGGYALPGGGFHKVFHTLHCMVCKGMDDEYFYIADPLDFNEKVPKELFMKIYRQLGSRAVAVVKKEE